MGDNCKRMRDSNGVLYKLCRILERHGIPDVWVRAKGHCNGCDGHNLHAGIKPIYDRVRDMDRTKPMKKRIPNPYDEQHRLACLECGYHTTCCGGRIKCEIAEQIIDHMRECPMRHWEVERHG